MPACPLSTLYPAPPQLDADFRLQALARLRALGNALVLLHMCESALTVKGAVEFMQVRGGGVLCSMGRVCTGRDCTRGRVRPMDPEA